MVWFAGIAADCAGLPLVGLPEKVRAAFTRLTVVDVVGIGIINLYTARIVIGDRNGVEDCGAGAGIGLNPWRCKREAPPQRVTPVGPI